MSKEKKNELDDEMNILLVSNAKHYIELQIKQSLESTLGFNG